MSKKSDEEIQNEDITIEESKIEEAEIKKTLQSSGVAKVDVVTSEKKVTMSAPVKEFESLKNSFKNMMTDFTKFMEAAGLEISKDETLTMINTLTMEFNELRKDLQTESAKISEGLVPRSEFEAFKNAVEAEESKRLSETVPRSGCSVPPQPRLSQVHRFPYRSPPNFACPSHGRNAPRSVPQPPSRSVRRHPPAFSSDVGRTSGRRS